MPGVGAGTSGLCLIGFLLHLFQQWKNSLLVKQENCDYSELLVVSGGRSVVEYWTCDQMLAC